MNQYDQEGIGSCSTQSQTGMGRSESISSTHPSLHNIDVRPAIDMRDLTGKVRKSSDYYFATGGYADIWRGILSDERGDQQVAIKILRNSYNSEYIEKLKQRLEREVRVWVSVSHPNIIPFLGACYDLNHAGTPSLVSPYLRNGNINTFLTHNSDKDKLELFAQVASALDYLHSLNPPIVHGDIKGSNVLIDDNNNACLSDFGISRILHSAGFTTKTLAGTVRWMSVELLTINGEDVDEDEDEDVPLSVTTASDVWGFGMMGLEIMTGHLPFSELKHDSHVLIHVIRGGRPARPKIKIITDILWTLFNTCWAMQPAERPSIRQVALALDLMLVTKDFGREGLTNVLHTEPDETDLSSLNIKSTAMRVLNTGPYRCKWGSKCRADTFPSLSACALHEKDIFLSLSKEKRG